MEIDIIARLFRLAAIKTADVLNAISAATDCDTLNKMMKYLWDKRELWHIPFKPGTQKEMSLITEKDWKYLTTRAASRCKELGGEFEDPTGTWNF